MYCISSVFSDYIEEDYVSVIATASIITAEGFWLDFWGYMFKISRLPLEIDEAYRLRILDFIQYGYVTRDAILKHASLFSRSIPILTEHNQGVLKSFDYATEYEYNLNRFVMTIEYTPQQSSSFQDYSFCIGMSYIDYNAYLQMIESAYSMEEIVKLVNNSKTAGVKMIQKYS
jgi:hypothetical protein